MNTAQTVINPQISYPPIAPERADLERIPAELRQLPRWVLWKLETRDGKTTKIPYAIIGHRADTTNKATWTTFQQAREVQRTQAGYAGLGCVIAPPYVGVDLDKCRDPESGEVEPWALQAIADLDSYTELSPSGRGFHIWVKGAVPSGGNRRGRIEMYGVARYFTMTGQHVEGTPTNINARDLTAFHATRILSAETGSGRVTYRNEAIVETGPAPRDESPSVKEFKLAIDIAKDLGPDATEAEVTIEFFKRATERPKWTQNKTYLSRTIRNAIEKARRSNPQSAHHAPLSAGGATIVRECFTDVEAKPIIWLWKDRIPKCKLTIFSGNPDCGKTTVLVDIIARYTTGRDYPDDAVNAIEPGEVLMLIAEDDPGDTIKPRLMAAGADLSRVSYLKAVQTSDKSKKVERALALDTDMKLLEHLLRENPHIGLVTIDPITGYLGRADLNKEQELRRVLLPIKELCERVGVTFIGLGHFNKRSDVTALHKVGGAVAMSGVARAVWMFAKSPEVDGEYVMLLGKGNLTKKRTGMKYRIGEKVVNNRFEAPFIAWQGEADGDADMVLATVSDPREKRKTKAKRFLEDYLADGPRMAEDIHMDGEKAGLSRNALFEAKKELKVTAEKLGGQWQWALAEKD
jgi:putative DNA primase/helicase